MEQPKVFKKFNRFEKRSGLYKCKECGKMTRETGGDESSCQMCYRCYEIAGYENMLSDGHIDQKEFERLMGLLKK